MDAKLKNEIIGRLWLYSSSVSNTKHLLEMAFRATEGKQNASLILENDQYFMNLKEFAKSNPNNQEGVITRSIRKEFEEMNPRKFPTWLECCSIYDAFVELAIVYFCQIFNQGNGFDSQTAKNDTLFREQHLDKILKQVFPTEKEFSEFEALKSMLVNARNKVIGHSDGEAYSISHSSPVSVLRGPNISWREINIYYWYSFLDKLINEINFHSNRLKLQN